MNKKNKTFIIIGIAFLISILTIAISVHKLVSSGYRVYSYGLRENAILNYLVKKYGDQGFSIKELEKEYSYEGIIHSYHTGYEATVSSNILNKNFRVYINSKISLNSKNFSDNFISNYYNEKTNEYLSRKYKLEFNMYVKEDKIPLDCNHIPTINELVDYEALDDIYISVYKSNDFMYDYDVEGRINYLKDLSKDLIDYFSISRNIDITFYRWANQDSYSYNINISNNTIKITDKNNEYLFHVN